MISLIVILALNAMGLGVELANHGKERTGKHNFFLKLLVVGVFIWLYYNAGLFNNFVNN